MIVDANKSLNRIENVYSFLSRLSLTVFVIDVPSWWGTIWLISTFVWPKIDSSSCDWRAEESAVSVNHINEDRCE